jgi:hypothetical protein
VLRLAIDLRFQGSILINLYKKEMKTQFVWGQIRVGLGGLKRSGFLRSLISSKPVTRDGHPLPWLTYAAINEISRRIGCKDRVLEIGAGNSSLWFAPRVEQVTSVETSEDWTQYIKSEAEKRRIKNLTVHVRQHFDHDLIESLVERSTVVLIDGAWRDLVAEIALKSESAKLIIIDNTDLSSPWARLPELFEKEGRTVARFRSMGPCLLHEWETSLVLPSSAGRMSPQ